MIVLDVNVLIAVFRADHVHHGSVRPWFDGLRDRETIVVPDLVWVGFHRLVTNNHVFDVPSPLDQALAFQAAILGSRAYRAAPSLPQIWDSFSRLAIEARAFGNLVPDAYIAAVASSLACPVATMDRDFRRFGGVQLIDPTAT